MRRRRPIRATGTTLCSAPRPTLAAQPARPGIPIDHLTAFRSDPGVIPEGFATFWNVRRG